MQKACFEGKINLPQMQLALYDRSPVARAKGEHKASKVDEGEKNKHENAVEAVT